MMRYQCLHTTRSALPTARRLLPQQGKIERVQQGPRGSSNGYRQAVRETRGGGVFAASDAGASSCLDEANHSLALKQGKAQSMRSSGGASLAEQSRQAEPERIFQGLKGPPPALVPCSVCDLEVRVRTVGVCGNHVNDIDRGCDDAFANVLNSHSVLHPSMGTKVCANQRGQIVRAG
jgi:hypothetical protein